MTQEMSMQTIGLFACVDFGPKSNNVVNYA